MHKICRFQTDETDVRRMMLVLFPVHCLTSPTGVMVGWNDSTNNIVCIVSVVSDSQATKISSLASVVGLWFDRCCSFMEWTQTESRLVIRLSDDGTLPLVYSNSDEVMVMLYSQPQPHSFVADKPLDLSNREQFEPSLSFMLCTLPECQGSKSYMDRVLGYINSTRDAEAHINSIINPHTRSNRLYLWGCLLVDWVVVSCTDFFGFITSLSGSAVCQSRFVQYLTSLPVLLHQSSLRISQMKCLCKQIEKCYNRMATDTTNEETIHKHSLSKDHVHGKPSQKYFEVLHQKQKALVCCINFISCLMLDILLGVAIVWWLNSTQSIESITTILLEKTEYVADLLSNLLHWMMGVPAGLKLNRELAEFLGKFFLYHIYLWQTYLKTIEPYLQTILWVSVLSGCLGMTFLLSLASDVFSILTIHIYCFYVYAARLYSLQIYGIMSLARLFTGKKNNILHCRVDSLPHDVDRLFIGTLMFTILFFLLPTTTLFYAVFTSLRLLVLGIKTLLTSTTNILNRIPLLALVIFCCKPSLLPGGLEIDVLESRPTNSGDIHSSVLYVKLHSKSLSKFKLLDWSLDDVTSSSRSSINEHHSWSALVGKILRGHLVYPWMTRD